MNKNISNYVEAFFEKFPYSKECFIAKEQIIECLSKEYEKNKDFENITTKYNSLEKIVEIAGYSKKDIQKWECKEEILEEDDVKKKFKQVRSYIIKFTLLSVLSVGSFIDIFTIGITSIIGFILWISLLGIFIYKYKKDDKVDNKKYKNYSINSFEFLKEKYDKYCKKLINGIFIAFIFFSYFIVTLISTAINSKLNEVIEFVVFYTVFIELAFFILIKNGCLIKLIKDIIHDDKVNNSSKHFRNLTFASIAYFIIFLIIELIFKLKFSTLIFAIAMIIYVIAWIIYTFSVRKNILYKNIVINKFKLCTYIIVLVIFVAYQFMQRDFWLVQPYINTVENIYNGKIDISYNEENGVYTIKNNKEDFKILHLTDIHLGGGPFSYTKDMKALKTVYDLIKHTDPDFVVVTGDLTFPMGIMSLSLNNSAPVMQFASFMRNLGVPWAFTYGNHDTESMAKYTKEDLNSLYKQLSYNTSKNLLYPYTQPNITGRNNQMIEIRNSDGTLNQAVFLIDSNAYTGEGINKYDYIRDEQVDWYKQNILELEQKEGKEISSLVFFHIPLQEYATAYELYEQKSDEVKYYFGENNEKMINKVCASEYPSKLFDTAVELGSTKGFFCGHDHYNNMSLEYKGIRLTYGMSIDYLAMPGIERDTEQRGGTLITISKDSKVNIEQIPYAKLNK